MKRTTLLVALVVIVGTLVVPAAGVLAQEAGSEDGDEEVAPGERLSGVVGVQAAEFEGEIERNAFRIGLERADDNASKASRIAEKLNESEQRLTELQERKAELEERRENGNISEGQYRARMARLATETETVRQQLDQSNATAAELPEETLEQNGVNATAIRTLSGNASELSGGEVSEIARSIAGDRSGMVERGPPGEDRPGDRNDSDDRPGDRNDSDDRPEAGTGGAGNATDGEDRGSGQQDGADDERTGGNETDGSDSSGGDGSDNAPDDY
jgi:hypothetical protein